MQTFKKDFINLFLERREARRKRVREILMCEGNINDSPLAQAPTADWDCNPATCPDGESNQQPFTLGDDAQPTEPHQSRL